MPSPLLTALFAGLTSPLPLQEAAPVAAGHDAIRARCTALLEDLRSSRDLPGVSAALVLPDGTLLTLCSGVSSRETERALEPEDLLLSGSIGKTYVAAVTLWLVGEGKLDLDRPIAEHLGERPWFERLPNGSKLTLRHLLRHRSGLDRYVFDPGFTRVLVAEPDREWKPEEQIEVILDRPPRFAPGEAFAYSDTNYLLVGLVIEQVTGRPYHELVRERLLEPHGLDHTRPSDRRRLPGLVQGYDELFRSVGVPERVLGDDGRFVVNPAFEWCGGGYANTPSDLARWARLFYGGRALEAPYLPALLDVVSAPQLGEGASYGPGLILRTTSLGELRGHDGIMLGYSSSMGWFVEHDLGVAVQANASRPDTFGRPGHGILVDLASIAVEELAADGDG